MKILISGASGLVGSALLPILLTNGHEVLTLTRKSTQHPQAIQWDPKTGVLNEERLEGVDAVIHLAGENIAGKRWTPEQKALIQQSRVQGTQVLCQALANLKQPPKTFISASAIGYYGNRGSEILTEVSPPAQDFLAMVCRQWESASKPLEDKSRVTHLRFGIILSKKGGALAKMLPIFQVGAGGPLGNGNQYMSWIALDDVVGAIVHALNTTELRGPLNVVAPNPVSNRDYTHTLGGVLFRPVFAPAPALALRLALGEMADALLLSSTRVEPVRLLESGYRFQYPELRSALKHVLKA